LPAGANITIPDVRLALERGDDEVLAQACEREIILNMNLSKRQRAILLAGGLLPYTVQERAKKINSL
ncbi:MAG TPA: hypothetical protein PKV83_03220, partial [Methanothrix sp.]|nr:hypothetical protein [Methanothrix sp.]